MARKTPDVDIFSVIGEEPTPPKKPTLRQFLKENPGDTIDNLYPVQKIWFPGNWDNYSVETNRFRVSISPKNPLFPALDSFSRRLDERNTGILVSVTDAKRGSIQFVDCTTYGEWCNLGNSGVEFCEVPM